MKFLVANLKTGQFVEPRLGHTPNKSDGLVFHSEEEARKFCRQYSLLSTHAVVPVPATQVAKDDPKS